HVVRVRRRFVLEQLDMYDEVEREKRFARSGLARPVRQRVIARDQRLNWIRTAFAHGLDPADRAASHHRALRHMLSLFWCIRRERRSDREIQERAAAPSPVPRDRSKESERAIRLRSVRVLINAAACEQYAAVRRSDFGRKLADVCRWNAGKRLSPFRR